MQKSAGRRFESSPGRGINMKKWHVMLLFAFFAAALLMGCTDSPNTVRTHKVDINNPELIEEARGKAELRTGQNCSVDISMSFVEAGGKTAYHMGTKELRDLYFYRFKCSEKHLYVTCEFMDHGGADYLPVLICY